MSDETTTEVLAEIEGQADDITPSEVANAALGGVWNQVQAERTIADLQHRLDVVASEWALQAGTISGLQQQLEAVKAELVQERLERNQWQNQAQRTETQLIEKISKCRNLQIELDALQQAPQAETAAAVPTSKDDRFEEGWDAGTARAVETIAEWLEPIRLVDNPNLANETVQNLPHIMRTLTGLTPED